jgi:MFS family permease
MSEETIRTTNSASLNLKEIYRFEKYPRMDWLDQFRGLVVILLIISAITWELSLSVEEGLGPIGPTYLNHGWKYWHWEQYGWPNIITIIDIGQQIFMFVVGFVAALSFLKRSEKEGEPAAVKHAIRRFVVLMALAIVDDGPFDNLKNLNLNNLTVLLIFIGIVVLGLILITAAFVIDKNKKGKPVALKNLLRNAPGVLILSIIFGLAFGNLLGGMKWGWFGIFWHGTLPNLAWGSLIAVLILKISKNSPDKRFILAIIIMIIHFVLIALPGLMEWKWIINDVEYFKVPYNTINHIAISITGTCTYQWWIQRSEDNQEYGLKKRVLPVATLSFVFCYLVDFLQPAEHRDVTTALALMAIGTSQFVMFIFYSFERIGFKVPMLSEFGKNLLLMFILLLVVTEVYLKLPFTTHEIFAANPLWAMVGAGVIPILMLYLIAWILAKKNIIIKF